MNCHWRVIYVSRLRQIFTVALRARQWSLLSLIALFCLCSAIALAVPGGDLAPRGNPDGQLTVGDLLILEQFVLEQLTPTPEEILVGDVAPLGATDGILNVGDIVVLQRAIFGEVSLPDVNLGPVTLPGGDLDTSAPLTARTYLVTGNISVPAGETLVVDPGAVFEFQGNYTLTVNGTLVAGDAEGAAVTFTSANATVGSWGGIVISDTSTGTVVDNAVIEYATTGITVDTASATLSNLQIGKSTTGISFTDVTGGTVSDSQLSDCATGIKLTNSNGVTIANNTITADSTSVTNGIYLTQSSATISGNSIDNLANGVTKSGNGIYATNSSIATISGNGVRNAKNGLYFNKSNGSINYNFVEDNLVDGIYLILSSPEIVGNTIQRNGEDGIECYYKSNPLIVGNTIIGNGQDGIDIYNLSSPGVTGNNIITDNYTGIYIHGAGATSNGNPAPTITENQIYGNMTYNLRAYYFYDAANVVLDVPGNWWGDTSARGIGLKIYDRNDSTNYSPPYVNFIRYLDAADGQPVEGNFISGGNIDTTSQLPAAVYDVVGDIVVPQGEVLTIAPGTTLRFAGHSLVVEGGLLVVGTELAPVTFTSEKELPKSGDWGGISVAGTSSGVELSNAVVEYAVSGVSVYGGGAAVIKNSVIFDSELYGININNSANVEVYGNRIDYSERVCAVSQNSGVNITNSSPLVSSNIISNSCNGITVNYDSSPIVTNNYINEGNFTGIFILGGASPEIYKNVIVDNFNGIVAEGLKVEGGNPSPIIRNNKIHANTYNVVAYDFFDANNQTVDCTENYWGTTDLASISSAIKDVSDDSFVQNTGSVPIVQFVPFWDAPGGNLVTRSVEGYQLLQGKSAGFVTLTRIDGPYLVIGNYYVPAGNSLFIESGAEVFFLKSAGMHIEGDLAISGTSTERVILTSYSLADVASWRGVNFAGSAGYGNIDHAVIEYAFIGVGAYNGASPVLVNSVVRNCTRGIWCQALPGNLDGVVSVNNSELTNEEYNYYISYSTQAPYLIDASSNYWGANDEDGIADMIRDSNENSSLPTVNYKPFLQKISPNGDGLNDVLTVCHDFGVSKVWSLTFFNGVGEPVKTFLGSGDYMCQEWDGNDESGVPVATGLYTYILEADDTQYAAGAVILDILGPQQATVSILEPPFVNYFNISLSLFAVEADEMQISEDLAFVAHDWLPFGRGYKLALSSNEGLKTVYVKFRDSELNETVVSDQITVDLSPPIVTVTSPVEGEIF